MQLKKPFARATVLVSLCFLGYLNSLHGDLVHDDIFAIKENEDVKRGTPISSIFGNDFWGKSMSDPTSHKSYRPLTVLSFRMNHVVHGLDPLGYHIVNVSLHTVCTILVWVTSSVLVFKNGSTSGLGFLAATIFAVHPIHTEAVSGVVGRADVLACILYLVGILLYGLCTEGSLSSPAKWIIQLISSLVIGVCAMLCKENGVTVFAVFLAYDCSNLFFLKRINPSTNRPLLIRIICVTMVTTVSLLLRISLLNNQLPLFTSHDNPASFSDSLLTRLLTYNYLFYFNAKLLLFPNVLCHDWQMNSIPLIETISDIRNFGTLVFFVYLFALSLVILLMKDKYHKHIVLMALVLTVVPFLPASNLFIRVGFVVAERILYIPSIGYCILVVYGMYIVDKQFFKNCNPFRAWQISSTHMIIVFLILLFTWKTILRNPVWSSRESLFISGVKTVPSNAKVHYNYGNFLKDSGRMEEAITYYRNTLKLCSDHVSAHNNLGTLLTGSEAVHHFQMAIKYNPRHYKAFFNLGNTLWEQRRQKAAIQSFKESLRINPNFTDAMIKLSSILLSNGDHQEAEALLKRALQTSPDSVDILQSYAVLLKSLNRTDEALSVYERALSMEPKHSGVLAGLARVHRSLGNTEIAENLLIRSVSINPDPAVYQFLGALYYNTGRIKESQDIFHLVLSIDSTNIDALCQYVQVSGITSGTVKEEVTETLSLLRKALKDHPNEYCVHLNLARIFTMQMDYKMALEYSTKAVHLASSNQEKSDAFSTRGTVLKDLKQLDEAAKDFQKAVQSTPEVASLWTNLGAVYHLMGKYEEAKQNYKRAQSIDPESALIQSNLEKLQRLIDKATKLRKSNS